MADVNLSTRGLMSQPGLGNGVFDPKIQASITERLQREQGLNLTPLTHPEEDPLVLQTTHGETPLTGELRILEASPKAAEAYRFILLPEVLEAVAKATGIPAERLLALLTILHAPVLSQTTRATPLSHAEKMVVRLAEVIRQMPSTPERKLIVELLKQTSRPEEAEHLAAVLKEKFLSLPAQERSKVVQQALSRPESLNLPQLEQILDQVRDTLPQESREASSHDTQSHQGWHSSSAFPSLRQEKADHSRLARPDRPGLTGQHPEAYRNVHRPSADRREHRPATTFRSGTTVRAMPATASVVAATGTATTQTVSRQREMELQLRESLGPALFDFVAALPPKTSVVLKPLLVRIAEERATARDIHQLLGQMMTLIDTPRGTAMEKILRTWNHPSWQMRLLVVKVLQQVAQRAESGRLLTMTRDGRVIPAELKNLARQTESMDVQSEAIRVALDMGERHQHGREEMEALLEELEVVRALNDLFGAKTVAASREAMKILSKAWAWLAADVRKQFLAPVFKLARMSRSEDVSAMALDFLLTHLRDLEDAHRRTLMEKGIYSRILVALQEKYRSGWTHFRDGQGPDVVANAMGDFLNRPTPVTRRAA